MRRNTTTLVAICSFFASLYFYLPFLTLYYQQRGLNFVQINALWGIIVGTMFFAEVPTGVLADWLGRKWSFSIALLLQVAGEVIYIFARDYWSFVGASVVAGLGFSFASGSMDALVYDSLGAPVRDAAMQRAMGTISAARKLGGIVAFASSALLIQRIETNQIVFAIALTALAVAVAFGASLLIGEPRPEQEREQQHPLILLGDGWRLLRGNRALQRLVLLALLTDPFSDYLLNLYPAYFQQAGVPTAWFGLALAAGGSVAAGSAQYAYWVEQRLGVRQAALLATALPGVLYLLMALVVHPIFSVLLLCTQVGAMGLKGPLFSAYLNGHIESRNRATVLSLISMVSGLYIALIGLLIGWLADLRLAAAFALMGAVVLASALLLRVDERVLLYDDDEAPAVTGP